MIKCQNCGSNNSKNLGMRLIGKSQKYKFQCSDCGFVLFDDKPKSNVTRFIISSIQNDTEVNEEFFRTLKSFAKLKDAEIMLLPTKYLGHLKTATWDDAYQNYIVNTEKNIGNSIKVLGDLYLLASLENPISGFDAVSKGRTVIVKNRPREIQEKCWAVNRKEWILTDPFGEEHITNALPTFCKENKLGLSKLKHIAFGRIKFNSGWNIRRYIPTEDQVKSNPSTLMDLEETYPLGESSVLPASEMLAVG